MKICALFLSALLTLTSTVSALKFNVEAQSQNGHPRCIRDFVSKDTLVVVNMKTTGYVGDGQSMMVYIQDNKGNEYGRKKNVVSDVRMGFTAHTDAAFDVCFDNVLTVGNHGRELSRAVELDIEIGANARDWNAIQAAEKLKPAELELRRIEEVTDELLRELEYLKAREIKLRDTNESTNHRIKVFSICIIFSLVAIGAWQIHYLRTYFRSKHII